MGLLKVSIDAMENLKGLPREACLSGKFASKIDELNGLNANNNFRIYFDRHLRPNYQPNLESSRPTHVSDPQRGASFEADFSDFLKLKRVSAGLCRNTFHET